MLLSREICRNPVVFNNYVYKVHSQKEEDGSSSSASGLICPTNNDFQLSDGASIAALLQVSLDGIICERIFG